jgi:hypothetical protein
VNNGICDNFPISNEEYMKLEESFGQLTKYASWQLLRKNTKNNHTDDFDDINQELIMSLIRAGSYYKRQIYIEKCLEVAKFYVKDVFIIKIVQELDNLWQNRTRHGANRQKFGQPQEQLLNQVMKKFVPPSTRPDKNALLKIDNKFSTYCKAITWNAQKSMGRKITKEKSIRAGSISLGDYDYLANDTM